MQQNVPDEGRATRDIQKFIEELGNPKTQSERANATKKLKEKVNIKKVLAEIYKKPAPYFVGLDIKGGQFCYGPLTEEKMLSLLNGTEPYWNRAGTSGTTKAEVQTGETSESSKRARQDEPEATEAVQKASRLDTQAKAEAQSEPRMDADERDVQTDKTERGKGKGKDTVVQGQQGSHEAEPDVGHRNAGTDEAGTVGGKVPTKKVEKTQPAKEED